MSGTVWLDDNGNGIREAGEVGIAGEMVYADLNNNSQLDATEPSVITATDDGGTAEDESGRYEFNLAAGNYVIRRVGSLASAPSYPTVLPGIAPSSFGESSYEITVGDDSISGVDFGNFSIRQAGFVDSDLTVSESQSVLTIRGQLSAPLGLELAVPILVMQGTARSPSDFEVPSAFLVFPAGSTQGELTIIVNNDVRYEGNEDFQMQIMRQRGSFAGDRLPGRARDHCQR